MAYRQVSLVGATNGYTIVSSPAIFTGSVACVSGEVYFRLKKVPDLGAANGANATLANPRTGLTDSTFLDGWNHITAGNVMEFGGERITDTTYPESVSQIDIFCVSLSEVAILGH